jgi:hypothetical protein
MGRAALRLQSDRLIGKLRNNESQGSEQREDDHQPLEERLINHAEQPASGKYSCDHTGREQEIERKAWAIDQPQGSAERYLKQVDGEKEPRRCTDKFELGKPTGEEINCHDRARRIGEHCCRAGKPAKGPSNSGMLNGKGRQPRRKLLYENQNNQHNSEPSEESPPWILGAGARVPS